MMSVKQAATRLAVSRRFVYRLCSNGQLEHYKLGSNIRISESSLELYLEAQKKSTQQPKVATCRVRKLPLSVLKLRQ